MTLPIAPAPAIDWNALFLALRVEGYTMHDVAAMVHIPRSTLIGWMTGAEPRHQDGETVIKFWQEVMDRPRDSLPIREQGYFVSRLAANRS